MTNIFVVTSNYFYNGLFGTYSTIPRARKAIESFFNESPNIASCEDIGNYCYKCIATDGTEYTAEILCDSLDAEYRDGTLELDTMTP